MTDPTRKRWHPQPAEQLSSTLRGSEMIDIYEFPCCGKQFGLNEKDVNSETLSQVRPDGCEDLPG